MSKGAPCRDYVMPFGRHRGKTLDQIASTSEGLRDLDWYLGQEFFKDPARARVAAYLADPDVARDLERALEERER